MVQPNGAHVYWAARQGQVGYLDRGNVLGYGPEHSFASCEASVLQSGSYSVGVANFREADNQVATIQVATPNAGVLFTKAADGTVHFMAQ